MDGGLAVPCLLTALMAVRAQQNRPAIWKRGSKPAEGRAAAINVERVCRPADNLDFGPVSWPQAADHLAAAAARDEDHPRGDTGGTLQSPVPKHPRRTDVKLKKQIELYRSYENF